MSDSYIKPVYCFNLHRVLSLTALITSLFYQGMVAAEEVCTGGLELPSRINVYASHHADEQSGIDGTFTLTRTGALAKQVTVSFVLSGTAQKSVDYSLLSESVVFEAGVSEKTVSMTPIDDTEQESTETINLVLTAGSGYTLGNHIEDSINIIDREEQLPQLQLSTSNLDFGEQQIQTRSSGQVISIVADNSNQANLVVGQLQVSAPFEINHDQCSQATVKSGHACTFEVVFHPDTVQRYENVLSIPSNGTNALITVSLSGIGQSEPSIDTGNDLDGLLTSLTVNGGGPDCKLDQLQWLDVTDSQLLPVPDSGSEFIAGFDFASYQLTQCATGAVVNTTVTYQSSIPVHAKFMQFGATAEDTNPHWYEIQTSQISGNQITYSLTDGGAGDLDTTANGIIVGQAGLLVPSVISVAGPVAPALLVEAPTLNVSEQSIGFGQQQVFANSQIRQLVVTSANGTALDIGQLVASEGFLISSDTCSTTVLVQGQQCLVELVFKPTAAEQYTGQLSIPSNDPRGTVNIELTGTGRSTGFRSNPDDLHPHSMSVNFSGGGAGCGLDTVNWILPADTDVLPQPPEFYEYLDSARIVEFQVNGCISGSKLQFSTKHSIEIPAHARLMQYGLIRVNGDEQWFEVDIEQASDHEQTFSVIDGQSGDLDMSANGSISVFMALLVPDPEQNRIPAARLSEYDSEILNGIRLSATELRFGRQRIDSRLTTRRLRITSHVNQGFQIGQLESTDSFQISKDLCSNRELLYRKNCSVDVQFVPQTVGDLEGMLLIPVETIDKSIIVALKGTGRAAKNTVVLTDSFDNDQSSGTVTELENRINTPQQQVQTVNVGHRGQGAPYQPIPVFNPVGMIVTILGLLGLARRSLASRK
ncbi:MAG: choice-of-anchor D domain-containing protein [Gammaproteobacteria bacterium]|nr:choice-of-anchor D domain-containing protein [Gammaproteobacteria bacterium]